MISIKPYLKAFSQPCKRFKIKSIRYIIIIIINGRKSIYPQNHISVLSLVIVVNTVISSLKC